jgi:hypothetical protein
MPIWEHFEICSPRLITCGMAGHYSIIRWISLLIARGGNLFAQPEVVGTISM